MSASNPHRTVNESHSGRTETDSEQLSNTSSPLFDPDDLGTEPSECGDSANPQSASDSPVTTEPAGTSQRREGREQAGVRERGASASTAFGDTTRILKIRPRWLALIMSREKTLEIRGGECPRIGWVTLAETGNKRILARARLGASYVLTEAEKEANSEALSHLSYKKPWAWPIEELEPLPGPIYIPSWVANGAVQWVTRERWETFDAEQSSQSLPATKATTLRNGRGRARKTAARPCVLWRETGRAQVYTCAAQTCGAVLWKSPGYNWCR